MNMEPEQESCLNCRWSRELPEEWQDIVRQWNYDNDLRKDFKGDEKQKRELLDLVYGRPVLNCMVKHCFIGGKYCCKEWEPKQPWYRVLPEDMQLIKNLLDK